MRNTYRIWATALMFASAFANHAWGEQKPNIGNSIGSKVSPPPTQIQIEDSSRSKPQTLDCTRPNSDARCKPIQPPNYYPHRNDPYRYRPRPVIINQLPPEPALEINSLTDDWDGCRKAKLGAMHARGSGRADEANNLDEWLWKNCRNYSYELRQLEQDAM